MENLLPMKNAHKDVRIQNVIVYLSSWSILFALRNAKTGTIESSIFETFGRNNLPFRTITIAPGLVQRRVKVGLAVGVGILQSCSVAFVHPINSNSPSTSDPARLADGPRISWENE